jgi:hypothetical protein
MARPPVTTAPPLTQQNEGLPIGTDGGNDLPALAKAGTRQRFQAITGAVKEHNDLLDLKSFWRGTDFAMLAYTDSIVGVPDAGARLQGAKDFLKTLKEMAWQAAPLPQQTNVDTLPGT